jgi:hypothetical protein
MQAFWFTIDADDTVAAFNTAGYGPMPRIVLEQAQLNDEPWDYLWDQPVRCEAIRDPLEFPGETHMAKRGLFGYDWTDLIRAGAYLNQYEREARPVHPIRGEELPERYTALLRAVSFDSLRFAAAPRIDARRLLCCIPASFW